MGESQLADGENNIEITDLFRYPVKGMTAEPLDSVALAIDETLPFDRAYALENGTGRDDKGRFDPAHPKHLPKVNFVMLMRNEKLAQIRASFNDDTRVLTLVHDGREVASGCLETSEGRKAIEGFIAGFMPEDLRGAPKLVSAPDHSFSDVAAKCLHIVNRASLRELEQLAGRPLDPLRFRPNLVLDGAPAFAELDWTGQTLATGAARLKVFKRTERCPATNVDPASARRDTALPDLLHQHFGHRDFGVYARVISPGEIHRGEPLALSQTTG